MYGAYHACGTDLSVLIQLLTRPLWSLLTHGFRVSVLMISAKRFCIYNQQWFTREPLSLRTDHPRSLGGRVDLSALFKDAHAAGQGFTQATRMRWKRCLGQAAP